VGLKIPLSGAVTNGELWSVFDAVGEIFYIQFAYIHFEAIGNSL